MFRRLKILTLMQLGDRLDVSLISNKKKFWLKMLFKLIIFMLITAVIYLVLFLVQNFIHVPVSESLMLFTIIFTQVLSIITCMTGLMNTLYLSKDNALLLSYPAKHNEVFISKIAVYYILDLLKNLMSILPFLLAFGIFNAKGLSLIYFFNMFVVVGILPLINCLIGALLSLPAVYIGNFLKSQPVVVGLILIGIFSLVFYGIITFVNSLPPDLRILAYYSAVLKKINNFLIVFNTFGLFYCNIAFFLVGKDIFINLLIVLAVIAVLAGLVFLVTMPTYFRLASATAEISSKSKRHTSSKPSKTVFSTFFKKELKMTVRNSNLMIGNFVYLLLMPFLLFLVNKIFSLISASEFGNLLILVVNVCLGLTMILASNTASATALSVEGGEFYLLKTVPSQTSVIAWAKVLVNMIFSTVAIGVTCVTLAFVVTFDKNYIWLIFALFMFINIGHILWSFEMDLLNPKIKEYIATGTIIDNSNATKSVWIGLALAFLTAGLLTFFGLKDGNMGYYKVLALAIVFFLARIYLFVNRLKAYFNEVEM
ncbi:MAG: hypothetical protein RR248_03795 [Clostridia bacterium]